MTSENPRPEQAHLSIAEAMQRLPDRRGERSVELLKHGSLLVMMYAPRGIDPQTPHSRDEIYVVARGSGVFYDGERHRPFGAGDLLFAPAKSVHRFEEFSDDFAVWVMFYGPEGGETPR